MAARDIETRPQAGSESLRILPHALILPRRHFSCRTHCSEVAGRFFGACKPCVVLSRMQFEESRSDRSDRPFKQSTYSIVPSTQGQLGRSLSISKIPPERPFPRRPSHNCRLRTESLSPGSNPAGRSNLRFNSARKVGMNSEHPCHTPPSTAPVSASSRWPIGSTTSTCRPSCRSMPRLPDFHHDALPALGRQLVEARKEQRRANPSHGRSCHPGRRRSLPDRPDGTRPALAHRHERGRADPRLGICPGRRHHRERCPLRAKRRIRLVAGNRAHERRHPRRGARQGLGLGEGLGRAILDGPFPHKDISVLAAAARLDVPLTVHVGVGYDILHEHPNCDGAALGPDQLPGFPHLRRIGDEARRRRRAQLRQRR